MASSEAQKRASREWYWRNRERQMELRRAHYRANKETYLEINRAWKSRNRARANELNKLSRARKPQRRRQPTDEQRLRMLETQRLRRKSDKCMAYNAEAAGRRRTRAASEYRGEILSLYAEARRLTRLTGVRHEVDHIVPLKHSLVCGLHTPCNLRVISADENGRKKNKFEIV